MLEWIVANPGMASLLGYVALNAAMGLVPTKYHNETWYGIALAILSRLSTLTPPDAKGTLKLPGTAAQPIIAFTEIPKPPKVPTLLIMAFLVMTGCAGLQPQGAPGVPPWTIAVSVTLQGARAAGIAVRDFIDGDQDISPQERDQIHHVLEIIDASLTTASASLAAYQSTRTVPAQCRLHADLETIVGSMAQIYSLLASAGAQVPPVVPAILGSLGSIADAVAPGCPVVDTPAAIRVVSAMQARQRL